MKEPYIISAEVQRNLLVEMIQLVKEFYGPATILHVKILNDKSDITATRVIDYDDDESVESARLTISETKTSSASSRVRSRG